MTKRFDSKTVLDRANLKIYEGEITTLIGKSGTGKSVLLKHIIGLLDPDEGDVLLHGKPVKTMKRAEWDRYRSRISYMFQSNALFDSMTVFENVALPQADDEPEEKEIEDKVLTRLEQMDLEDVTDKFPSELSGGMQKRVALARALVTDPEIVLFDEPTTGQDPIRRNAILSMIAQYRKKFGFTAVIISHDIPDIFFISDRILLLWEGKISFRGTYEELTEAEPPPPWTSFAESIEGFQDELTGLLSKQTFRSRYAATLGRIRDSETASRSRPLPRRVRPSLGSPRPEGRRRGRQSPGEFINKTFGALGGFLIAAPAAAREAPDHTPLRGA
ncbi:MAG: ATP-binding cassette domain-containing protein [Desulfomicrobium escambiense]|nr:ATP-binding cassette domain-containing protein [Desulfomicrobium escambiense]